MGLRYARYIAVLGLIALFAFAVHRTLTAPGGAAGLVSGEHLPAFAAPLATSGLRGDVNVARHADDGQAGRRPACAVRGPAVLNICQLYERGPVVLALFIDAGSCPRILGDMQALARSFPDVRFAAVGIKGQAASVARLVRSERLTLPVGIDRDGVLAGLYKLAGCPQVTFAYPGGIVQSAALLERPSPAALRARVSELLAASRARGWRPRRA